VDIENSKIGVKVEYPENWTIQFTKGESNSVATSHEMFKDFIKMIEKNENFNNAYPTDSDKYQYFLNEMNFHCGLITDCRLIGDTYLRNFLRDSTHLRLDYVSIFDYVPSLAFLPPVENLTDSFLENVKIASFTLPSNSTLIEFIHYYISHSPYHVKQIHCQSSVLGYPGCEIIYTFTVGHSIESRQYKTLQFIIEKNHRVYLISYNALTDTYLKYIELVGVMLKSIKLL
jgi:hypothetical protein